MLVGSCVCVCVCVVICVVKILNALHLLTDRGQKDWWTNPDNDIEAVHLFNSKHFGEVNEKY